MVILIGLLAAAALLLITVPKRVERFLNECFMLLVTPFRDIAVNTGRYLFGFSNWSISLLALGGISPPRIILKMVGTITIFAIAALSILADIDLIMLTMAAIGIGSGTESSIFLHLGLQPASAFTIALIAGAAMMGILFLDYFIPGFLPDTFTYNRGISKVFMVLGLILLIGSLACMGILASIRAQALEYSSTVLQKAINTGNTDVLNLPSIASYRTIVFVFVSILTLLNSVIGVLVLPSALMVFCSVLMALLVIPIALIHFVASLCDRGVTLLYNIVVSFYNMIEGILHGLSQIMGNLFKVDDSVDGVPDQPQRTVPDPVRPTGPIVNPIPDKDDPDNEGPQNGNKSTPPLYITDFDLGFNPLNA